MTYTLPKPTLPKHAWLESLGSEDLYSDAHVQAAYEAGLADSKEQKDAAYLERNQCVALIAKMAIALKYKAGRAKTAIEGWSEDWHGCVYIDLPSGQMSWHYHDSQAYLFAELPLYYGFWDGHDTSEKYKRVASFAGLRAAPEGWKLVPIVPTAEMCNAAVKAMYTHAFSSDEEEASQLLADGIAAAQEPLK